MRERERERESESVHCKLTALLRNPIQNQTEVSDKADAAAAVV